MTKNLTIIQLAIINVNPFKAWPKKMNLTLQPEILNGLKNKKIHLQHHKYLLIKFRVRIKIPKNLSHLRPCGNFTMTVPNPLKLKNIKKIIPIKLTRLKSVSLKIGIKKWKNSEIYFHIFTMFTYQKNLKRCWRLQTKLTSTW